MAADKANIGTIPQAQPKRIQYDGLACTGFSADDAHATIELKLQLVHKREVLNFQVN